MGKNSLVHKGGSKQGRRHLLPSYYSYERLIVNKLYPLAKAKLHPNQIGLSKKRSVTLQMMISLDKVYKLYDDEAVKQLRIVYFDFAEAFNTVPHTKLISTSVWIWRETIETPSIIPVPTQTTNPSKWNYEIFYQSPAEFHKAPCLGIAISNFH